MANQRLSKRILHICMVMVIIIVIVFIAMMFILHYDVNGETNMPFSVSKISIISTTEGNDVENSDYKWAINIFQNNDIYIYIEKNDAYKKQETIESVKLENLSIKQNPNIGEIKIYNPTSKIQTSLFENIKENEASEITFTGSKVTDTRNLQISNQGGMICFRAANINIGQYLSNDDEQINYNELLQKVNVNEDDLKATISFDILITLHSNKIFKAEGVELQIPNYNVVKEGTVGIEDIQLQNIIFKRVQL